MLIFSGCMALLVGWLCGGRLSHWENTLLKWLPLPVIALLLQRALSLLSPQLYPQIAPFLLLLSYGLLILFCVQNRHLVKTSLLTGLGSLSNLAVIAANGFRMPVSKHAAACLSPTGLADLQALHIPMYALAGEDTRLLFLGDVIYCPIPLLRGFASVGDILLAFGLFFCLMAIMQPSHLPRWFRAG